MKIYFERKTHSSDYVYFCLHVEERHTFFIYQKFLIIEIFIYQVHAEQREKNLF
jgi:hypothetical protein